MDNYLEIESEYDHDVTTQEAVVSVVVRVVKKGVRIFKGTRCKRQRIVDKTITNMKIPIMTLYLENESFQYFSCEDKIARVIITEALIPYNEAERLLSTEQDDWQNVASYDPRKYSDYSWMSFYQSRNWGPDLLHVRRDEEKPTASLREAYLWNKRGELVHIDQNWLTPSGLWRDSQYAYLAEETRAA